MGPSFFSVPPRAASRRTLSSAINASRPRRTSAVFSSTPVSRRARPSSSSSMLSVVFIEADAAHAFLIGLLERREADFDHLLPWIRGSLQAT